MNYVIGVGGVGSYLAPVMCKLVGAENITLIDGDTLEAKNLDRQLFSESEIGRNKAEALAEKYGCQSIASWYSEALLEHSRSDWLLVGVDNHAARASALTACDMAQCCAIFAANETHSSEAYVYLPQWRGTALDPRVYYPEISTDESNDPRRGGIGCTGEAQKQNRQLVTANFMAAALMADMYSKWAVEARKMSKEAQQHLPFKLVNNLSRNETYKAAGATTKDKQ